MRFNKSCKIPQEPPYLLNLCRTRVLKKTSPFILLTQSKYNSKNILFFFYRRFYLFLYFLFVRGNETLHKIQTNALSFIEHLKNFRRKKKEETRGGNKKKGIL